MSIRPMLSSLGRHKATCTLLVLQIALTCAIVCNAVFIISQRLTYIHMSSGIVENELSLVRLADVDQGANLYARVQEDLAALGQIPGVKQVASLEQVPFGQESNNADVRLDRNQQKTTETAGTYFGENLINTFGVRVLEGRNLEPGDYVDLHDAVSALDRNDAGALPKVTLLTRSLAHRLWPDADALGKTIWMGGTSLRVVGVIDDLARPSIWNERVAHYSIVAPLRMPSFYYGIRTAPQDRERVLKLALAKLKEIDAHRVVLLARPWEETRQAFFEEDRAMAGLLTGVCVALLTVTALGIVGLGSFWVSQRRRQIGVRRALGATRRDILRYFQLENFLLATIGIVLGMVLAYAINLFLMVRYELPHMPAHYLTVGAAVLWAVGQLAVLGPAMRAAAVPPVVATRAA